MPVGMESWKSSLFFLNSCSEWRDFTIVLEKGKQPQSLLAKEASLWAHRVLILLPRWMDGLGQILFLSHASLSWKIRWSPWLLAAGVQLYFLRRNTRKEPVRCYKFQKLKAAECENHVLMLTFYYLHTQRCFRCLPVVEIWKLMKSCSRRTPDFPASLEQ